MTKTDIKIFFKAVSDGDLKKVSELLDNNPEYLTICNVAPPKKDDGQSGLQVAFKTGRFENARLLIEKGADTNFMLSKNADPRASDSYGNNCLHRALMDARQMLDNPSTDFTDNILIQQLQSVFKVLIKAGADTKQKSDNRESAEELYLNFKLDKYRLW
jgi:ankyrin repeat protein